MEKDRYGQRYNMMQNDGKRGDLEVEIHINGVGKMEGCRGVNWKREMGCAGKMKSNGVKRQLRDMRGDDRERWRESDRRREL